MLFPGATTLLPYMAVFSILYCYLHLPHVCPIDNSNSDRKHGCHKPHCDPTQLYCFECFALDEDEAPRSLCGCHPGGRGHLRRRPLTHHTWRWCKQITNPSWGQACTIHWLIQKQQMCSSMKDICKIDNRRPLNVPNSRNPSLMPRNVFHFRSVSFVFPSWANPDDASTHMGPLWEKLWVRQTGASRTKVLVSQCPLFSCIGLLLAHLTCLPQWILHHNDPLTFALSWWANQPAAFDTWWRKIGQHFGLTHQTHSTLEEATLSFGVEEEGCLRITMDLNLTH